MPTRTPNRLFYVRKTDRGANKQREKSIQRALMTTLRLEFPFVVDFFNDWAAGAYLTPGQYQERRRLSSGKGWSDLFIPYPSRGHHGFFLEIKRENVRIYRRDGNLIADEQIRTEAAFLERMNRLHYFARFGVEVCDRWRYSFINFLTDMGLKPSKDHTLDRVKGSKNYEPENCRWTTQNIQAMNQKLPSSNTSGFRGVSPVKGGRWRASIGKDGINHYLGEYRNKLDAARAYNAAAIKFHGEYAQLNVVRDDTIAA